MIIKTFLFCFVFITFFSKINCVVEKKFSYTIDGKYSAVFFDETKCMVAFCEKHSCVFDYFDLKNEHCDDIEKTNLIFQSSSETINGEENYENPFMFKVCKNQKTCVFISWEKGLKNEKVKNLIKEQLIDFILYPPF